MMIKPLDAHRDKYTLKFWERAKRVDAGLWNSYRPASQRLKTQVSPLLHADSLRQRYQLTMGPPAPLHHFVLVVPALPTSRLDLPHLNRPKNECNPFELRSSAMEAIHTLYPSTEWLHVYTDGSYIPELNGTGAGWHCEFFEDFRGVGRHAGNFDGEICAVHEAADCLLSSAAAIGQVVFLIDSQAAISALSSNTPSDSLRTIQCRVKLSQLIEQGWAVHLKWIPSHVDIPGNERADALAKRGASSEQPSEPATLRAAHNKITHTVDATTRNALKQRSSGKRWECLAADGPIRRELDRRTAVALFRTTTGHDYLQAHLHRIGLAADDKCPLCLSSTMDAQHLLICPSLGHIPNVMSLRYWEARRLMASLPRAGVG